MKTINFKIKSKLKYLGCFIVIFLTLCALSSCTKENNNIEVPMGTTRSAFREALVTDGYCVDEETSSTDKRTPFQQSISTISVETIKGATTRQSGMNPAHEKDVF